MDTQLANYMNCLRLGHSVGARMRLMTPHTAFFNTLRCSVQRIGVPIATGQFSSLREPVSGTMTPEYLMNAPKHPRSVPLAAWRRLATSLTTDNQHNTKSNAAHAADNALPDGSYRGEETSDNRM